ncbi:ribulose-phosphate 3-epimerase [Amnibacterium kyonggiense]|uniref:Ribulose-phosphate 3-epimerase n=1 Tax=Amnibacterium kyonggiense TaxID=595671 RepID=A0A4V3EAP8_9MICO|nr:ribulose-phosphate 3-epimerase [Amnibacterium kyonggiense]TDS77424.1 ribulose-5-phosphate 3-epimerase [Amnibacterium kyonggiense]
MAVRIEPSILSADFASFASEIARIPSADLVHCDVMDGHFVPNLTFGLPMVRRLAQVSALPLDVHLMIDDPDRWAPGYAEAGAHTVTFHAEAATSPIATARAIRAAGARAGIALKPTTDAAPFLAAIDEFDQVLVMTVEPGFGGQSFMAELTAKVREVRSAIGDRDVWLQVDGGIGADTIAAAAAAGADTFVAGSAVFGQDDPDAAVQRLRALASRA